MGEKRRDCEDREERKKKGRKERAREEANVGLEKNLETTKLAACGAMSL